MKTQTGGKIDSALELCMGGLTLLLKSAVPGEGRSSSLSHQVQCLDANLFFTNVT